MHDFLKRTMPTCVLVAVLTTLLLRTGMASATSAANCGAWSVVPSPNVGTSHNYLNAVDAATSNNAWAVGYYASSSGGPMYQKLIERWDSLNWSVVYSPDPINGGSSFLTGVDALSANNVWTVGYYFNNATDADTFQTLIEHWNKGSWSVIASPNVGKGYNILNSVTHVPSTHQLWAVGDEIDDVTGVWQTLIETWNGTSWSIVHSPNIGTDNNILTGVVAVSARNVWAVGSIYPTGGGIRQALILHWDGTAWSVVPSPGGTTSPILYSVTQVPGTSHLWTVGLDNTADNGTQTLTAYHQGRTWTRVPSPNVGPGGPNTASALNGVAAVSVSDVWAVGYSQAINGVSPTLTLIEQWNGSQWNIVASPSPDGNDLLYAVARVPRTSEAWAVGYSYNGSVTQTLIEFYC